MSEGKRTEQKKEKQEITHVDAVVVGAGFAGMTAALTLAYRGLEVVLIERKAAPGGHFPLLDKQFPTNSCGVCFLSPQQPAYCPFIECELERTITLLTDAKVVACGQISKSDRVTSAYDLTVSIHDNYIDNTLCIDCGACTAVCPVEVPNEFGDGIEKRKAVYKIYPKMVKNGYRVDARHCTRCGRCVAVCPTDAVDLDRKAAQKRIRTASVILSPGFSSVTGRVKTGYGFGIYPNVLSAVRFERLVSASGPTGGTVERPSDGTVPESIGFIQCVGSRDTAKHGNPYCSSVCCMFALKQAVLAKERHPDTRVVLFYIDLRTVGKDYEEYLREAEQVYGVELIRCHVSVLNERTEDHKLYIHYDVEGESLCDTFDMAVLSLGIEQSSEAVSLAETFGITVNKYGFAEAEEFAPNSTDCEGIFAAGCFTGPKDIPETASDGLSAAGLVLEQLGRTEPAAENGNDGLPNTGPVHSGPASSIPTGYENPRVGVLLYNSGRVVPFQEHLVEAAKEAGKELEQVVYTGVIDRTDRMKSIIAENGLNRVVLAGDSVRELDMLCDRFAEETGYSRLDFEVVHVMEAVPSVEFGPEAAAEEEAGLGRFVPPDFFLVKQLFKAAAVKAAKNRGTVDGPGNGTLPRPAEINGSVLVIGGGAAGITAAINLSGRGIRVSLVEKEPVLGGRMREAVRTLKGTEVRPQLDRLLKMVEESDLIDVYTGVEVIETSGTVGARMTRIRKTGAKDTEDTHLHHGAVIIATGASEAPAAQYGYGTVDTILTQAELERELAAGSLPNRKRGSSKLVVMIQCAGSREAFPQDGRPYCSRVCCNHALKNIETLRSKDPEVSITVLYRDMRCYGFYEDRYREAREAGALFVPYGPENKPEVTVTDGTVKVSFFEPMVQALIEYEVDLLVLSTGMVPRPAADLARLYGVEQDKNGFFKEVNPKTGIVNTVHQDVFICGTAHAPKHFEESIIHARAAAAKAGLFVSRGRLVALEKRAFVVERFCSGCAICVKNCPFEARVVDPKTRIAEVRDHICLGCGACVTACPNGASGLFGFEKGQVLEYVDNLCELEQI